MAQGDHSFIVDHQTAVILLVYRMLNFKMCAFAFVIVVFCNENEICAIH